MGRGKRGQTKPIREKRSQRPTIFCCAENAAPRRSLCPLTVTPPQQQHRQAELAPRQRTVDPLVQAMASLRALIDLVLKCLALLLVLLQGQRCPVADDERARWPSAAPSACMSWCRRPRCLPPHPPTAPPSAPGSTLCMDKRTGTAHVDSARRRCVCGGARETRRWQFCRLTNWQLKCPSLPILSTSSVELSLFRASMECPAITSLARTCSLPHARAPPVLWGCWSLAAVLRRLPRGHRVRAPPLHRGRQTDGGESVRCGGRF
jgi:hypothetical protein